ncbi:MAG: phage Gp37/Gp68 family protein [Parasphingorhabdus sp.]|nr:phage Gp37/Gp68 family protein [Parasphingorhabdus sp.]
MSTKIEWTDETWNPITGCTVKSAGCRDCYAMTLAGTRLKNHPSRAGLTRQNAAGKHIWTGEVRFNEAWLDQPLKWKKPRMIFVCAHGDLFHESVPDEWIDRVFAVMSLCQQHVFQVLTKRADRMREYVLSRVAMQGNIGGCAVALALQLGKQVSGGVTTTYPAKSDMVRDLVIERVRNILPNVWLGTSVEDQEAADERITDLLETPAAVRWLSCEPLLGSIDFDDIWWQRAVRDAIAGVVDYDSAIDWVVLGGESGNTARPMHPDWARQIRDQCEAADVPFFFKQWGEYAPHPSGEEVTIRQFHNSIRYVGIETGECKPHPDRHTDETMRRMGKKKAGRQLDGRTHDAFPQVAS